MQIVSLVVGLVAIALAGSGWAQFVDEAMKCFDPAPRPADMSIRFCTAAIDSGRMTGPALAAAFANRGHAEHAKGQFARAIQDYTDSLRLNPGDARIHFSRGVAYLKQKQDGLALGDFNEALRVAPNDPLTHYHRGLAAWRQGQLDQALRDYDAAIRLDPAQAAPYGARGDVYRMRGDRARAIQDYDHALQLNPRGVNAYFGRGLSRFDQGQFAAAEPDLARAAELDPSAVSFALYLYLALELQRKDGRPVLATVARGDLTRWPGPVVAMYLGRLKPAAVLAAASRGGPELERVQRCQASFYVGHEMLLRGNTHEALQMFKAAVATGAAGLDEYESARAQLKRSGA